MLISVQVFTNDSDAEGGERALVGYGVGGGRAALVIMQATNNKSIVAATTTSTVLVAANLAQTRVGGKIANGGTGTLHIAGNPSGQKDVLAGDYADIDDGYQGVLDGWWDPGATGNAYVSEVTV